ncbi:hypothetical protein AK812_SmicGene28424 [Symbiodinium microadriaticum]|uniref:Uncharacterized protein n=1 Tax=Symbiodinium microadriaticum TaxID=2951 RepID=A0A1Q9D4H4_SYMMI|nr:hypothetical protein AK812_SmicGene28424 [Symbiodinium microadriaticum]
MPDQISKTLRPSSSSAPAPSSSLPPGSPDFAKGEKIQVWSESRQEWLLGVVQEVFSVDSKSEGFDVPAGSVKVLSETGVKWVLPKDRARMLQKVQVPSSLDLKAMLKAALSEPSTLHRHAESVDKFADRRLLSGPVRFYLVSRFYPPSTRPMRSRVWQTSLASALSSRATT